MNSTFPRQQLLQLWKYVAAGVLIQVFLASILMAGTPGSQTPHSVANVDRISRAPMTQDGFNKGPQNSASSLSNRDERSMSILSIPALAIDVSGTVTDEKGMGIPGVNVLVKGTTTGTVTDVNGVFTLQVESENSVLVFSSIGFVTQEVIVGNRKTINLALQPDIRELNEVVVVGYGTQKREDLTGAIASVSGEDLKKVFITTPDQAMQGRVAGVQVRTTSHEPGGGVSVQIRGTSSLSASSQPLYVIDGFPISNDYESVAAEKGATVPNQLNSIDPTTIESIEILKDASATAIYGSRATNGVVLITTKRGKTGPAHVDYSSSVAFEHVAKKFDLLNATEWGELVNEANDLNGQQHTFSDEQIAEMGVGTDWQDVIYRTAVTQRHMLSVSGGNENLRYMVSGNYTNQEGVIIESGLKRYAGSVNLDANVSKKLTIGTSTMVSHTDNARTLDGTKSYSNEPSMVVSIFYARPNVPAYDADGNMIKNGNGFPGGNGEDTPLYMAKQYQRDSKTIRMLTSAFANYEIMDGLNFKVRVGMDYSMFSNNTYYPIGSRIAGSTGGQAARTTQELVNFLNENTLEYKHVFNDKHQLTALVGYTSQNEKNETATASAFGFPSDFYGYRNLGIASNPQPSSSYESKWVLLSYLGRLNYILNDKYLLTATARYDGSSKFGKNNKYGFFPSAAVAWRLSEEDFIKELGLFTHLKLRAGYGATGNERIGVYKSISTIAAYNNFSNGYGFNGQQTPVAWPANIANPDLSWEKAEDYNIGLDMGFFQNRISVILDVYKKKTTDLLLNTPLPKESGYASVLQNVGSMENKGFEITLNTVNTTGAFEWTSNLNFSINKNKVLDLGGADFYFTGWTGGGNNGHNGTNIVRIAPGQPVGAFWGSIYDGIYNDQAEIDAAGHQPANKPGSERFRDVNNDGVWTEADDVYIGDPNPDYIFGFNNDFTWKQFTLNVFTYGEVGQDVANLVLGNKLQGSTNLLRSDREARWTPENPDGTSVAANQSRISVLSTRNVVDGTFVRIKNITLAYNLPAAKMNLKWLRSLQISAAAENPFLFTDYEGYDPEVNSYGSLNDVKGVDRYAYPSLRGFRLGLNVGF
jgi:TonB-linked SusC/RagA family outer membrane protein